MLIYSMQISSKSCLCTPLDENDSKLYVYTFINASVASVASVALHCS